MDTELPITSTSGDVHESFVLRYSNIIQKHWDLVLREFKDLVDHLLK